MRSTFDFIVIGAGSAGCVLANRLSAAPNNRVLVVEAGPRDWNPVFRVPIMAGRLFMGRYCNWSFETEPEPHLNGRRIPWPRGRVLGGSSSINGMIYARGNRLDYDGWAQLGLRSWSYERVLEDFKRSEHHYRGAGEFHGSDGPLPVGPPTSKNPLFDAFIEAGAQAGYRRNPDFNGADQEGVGRYDYNIWGGQRWSSARSFLDPARARPNLEILTGAQLLNIIIEQGRATGVRLLVKGRPLEIRAEREVILSCGAVNSPMALMHSGVGDADRLKALGIPVIHDLKGVGRNLHDHLHVVVAHQSRTRDETYDELRVDRAASGFLGAALFGKGPFSRFPHEGGAFLKTDPALASPDVQIHFFAGGAGGVRHPFARKSWSRYGDGYVFYGSVCQLRPESRGELTLRSSDPLEAPAIRANYLSTETDRRTMREGVKIVRELFRQPAFDAHRGAELTPGPQVRTDSEINAFVAANGSTIFHPVGSCRMGIDDEAVVDEQLKVRGIEGLRVADASIMPRIVSANTHAAAVMIGERAADLILHDEASLQAPAARRVSATT
jgi:choline dehydrogenase